ncbi:MAG: T9SS C-terminal target domain-containing protein [Gemmatimonadetes bacterium]|nr:MAG: T9SS C-terminal target domain-containing protein [Gemmatimonadota bacterium]
MVEEYGPSEFIYVAYHTSDPYAIPDGDARWSSFYHSTAIPDTWFDGTENVLGGWDGCYDDYLDICEAHWAEESPILLELFGSITETEGQVTASVTLEETIEDDANIHFEVVENHVIGARHFNNMLRQVLETEPLGISEAGETATFERTFTMDSDWNYENIAVVVFIQRPATADPHNVYQAAYGTIETLLPPAAIEGYVTDCDSELGLDVTSVYAEGTSFTTTTDADGFYHLNLEPGTHTIIFERFGYDTYAQEVTVAEDDLLPVDVCLNAFESSTLTGQVTQLEDNVPLPHVPVELLNVPIEPTLTDENGRYTFTVPGGYTYEISVYADDREPQVVSVPVPENQEVVMDIPMRFVQSFEASDGDFTANRLWEWGAADPSGGAENAYMGLNVWVTDINGPYRSNTRADLITPVYSLVAVDDAQLEYAHWLDTNEGWDGYNVSISTDNGENWTRLVPEGGYNSNAIVGLSGQAGFSGDANTWEIVHFDLNDYLGEVIQLRFRFGSTNNNRDFLGVCIDYFDLRREGTVGVAEELMPVAVPATLVLEQNIPNPFNPMTAIRFSIPSDQYINLSIYDVNGRLIQTLHDGWLQAGNYRHMWNGTNQHGVAVSSGTYLYRLHSNTETITRQMVLLR